MAKYAVLKDVTPNRATVVSVHDQRDDALAAYDVEGDEATILDTTSASLEVGDRVYHDGVRCWLS